MPIRNTEKKTHLGCSVTVEIQERVKVVFLCLFQGRPEIILGLAT
jgi:hypothetical protein